MYVRRTVIAVADSWITSSAKRFVAVLTIATKKHEARWSCDLCKSANKFVVESVRSSRRYIVLIRVSLAAGGRVSTAASAGVVSRPADDARATRRLSGSTLNAAARRRRRRSWSRRPRCRRRRRVAGGLRCSSGRWQWRHVRRTARTSRRRAPGRGSPSGWAAWEGQRPAEAQSRRRRRTQHAGRHRLGRRRRRRCRVAGVTGAGPAGRPSPRHRRRRRPHQ